MKNVFVLGAGPSSAALISKLVNFPIRIIIITGEELEHVSYPFVQFQSNFDKLDINSQVRPGVDGAGKIWGGRLVRFDKDDFDTRHVESREKLWPISFAEYSEYFQQTEQFFEIGKNSFTSEQNRFRLSKEQDQFLPSTEVWSLRRDFLYQELSSSHVARIEIWKGICIRINQQNGNLVSMLYQENDNLREIDLIESICVLGFGALENARQTLLLKISQALELNLLPPRLDFASHHFIKTPPIYDSSTAEIFNMRKDEFGVRKRMRIRMNSKALGGLNGIFFLAPDSTEFHKLGDAFFTLRKALKSGTKFVFKKIWRHRNIMFRNLKSLVYTKKYDLHLWIQLEHHRNSRSFLKISEHTYSDKFPILEITCDTSAGEKNLIFQSILNANRCLEDLGISVAEDQKNEFLRDFSESTYSLNPNTHFCCTTPMSIDSQYGEVDSEGRSHNFKDLWYVGSSVFSTSSHANPTYSAVLFALRTGDRIAKTLKLNLGEH